MVDESHATVPQIGGMYAGDRSRKTVLVDHGFRLPSALDNRPLNFEEFQSLQNQTIYVERHAVGAGDGLVARAGGGADRAADGADGSEDHGQAVEGADRRFDRGGARTGGAKERMLVTTLTKRTAEELTDYLRGIGVNVRYLHSEIDAIERVEMLRALRKGEFDVLVGINLLREGLDLPEVSLVAILDADKEGYLRSDDQPDPDGGPGRAAYQRRSDPLRGR